MAHSVLWIDYLPILTWCVVRRWFLVVTWWRIVTAWGSVIAIWRSIIATGRSAIATRRSVIAAGGSFVARIWLVYWNETLVSWFLVFVKVWGWRIALRSRVRGHERGLEVAVRGWKSLCKKNQWRFCKVNIVLQ